MAVAHTVVRWLCWVVGVNCRRRHTQAAPEAVERAAAQHCAL